MPVGFPSIRVDETNERHHLWCNNGTWWVHYTVHFDHRKRRVRRSLGTRSLAEAILRRDSLLLRIAGDGEPVVERAPLDGRQASGRPAISGAGISRSGISRSGIDRSAIDRRVFA